MGFDGTSFLANSDRFNYFGGALSEQPNANFPALSVSLPAMKPVDGVQYGAFQNPGAGTDLKYLAELGPQVFPRQNGFGNVDSSPPYPQSVQYHAYLDKAQASSLKGSLRRPPRSKYSSRPRRPLYPSPAFLQSVMYRAGPNGPKRS